MTRSLVIDLYGQRRKELQSPATELARHLGGELCPVESLQAENVAARVRSRLLEG